MLENLNKNIPSLLTRKLKANAHLAMRFHRSHCLKAQSRDTLNVHFESSHEKSRKGGWNIGNIRGGPSILFLALLISSIHQQRPLRETLQSSPLEQDLLQLGITTTATNYPI